MEERQLRGRTRKTGRPVGRPRTIEAAHQSLAQVLTLVRSERATTRLELEQSAELSRAVVADRIAALEMLGLVEEGETAASNGGRAPRRLRFRADAGRLLLATLDRTSISVGIADLAGKLIGEHHEAAELEAGAAAIVDRLTTLFTWMAEDQGGRDAVWGVGLAVPGPVDADAGAPLALEAEENWRDFDFAAELELRFGAPAWIRSGTEMMTIGEMQSGDGAGDMLFVKLGRTISAGVVSGGRLQRGAHGAAGMIGHVQTGETATVTCRCGSRFCLEAVAGGEAVARAGLAAAESGASPYLAHALAANGEVSAADVGHGAQLGDAFSAELVSRCGRLIGESLAPIVNVLNPSLIVLGGSVAQSGDILLAAVREAVYRQAHPLVTRDLRIVRSRMGNSSGLVGAASTVAAELFEPHLLQNWVTLGTPRRLPALADRIAATRAARRSAASAPPAP